MFWQPEKTQPPNPAAVSSGSRTISVDSQAPAQACNPGSWVPGLAFPQVTFSKSHNMQCISIARANSAGTRIETSFPLRNDSQAGRPAHLPPTSPVAHNRSIQNAFPKNTKEGSRRNRLVALCPPCCSHSRGNHLCAHNRDCEGDPKIAGGAGCTQAGLLSAGHENILQAPVSSRNLRRACSPPTGTGNPHL